MTAKHCHTMVIQQTIQISKGLFNITAYYSMCNEDFKAANSDLLKSANMNLGLSEFVSFYPLQLELDDILLTFQIQ